MIFFNSANLQILSLFSYLWAAMTESDYSSAIEHIFVQFPSFQKVGDAAYKPGLQNMFEIDEALGRPSSKFNSVHIAGTNGKGSVSHMIASALMQLDRSDVFGSDASDRKFRIGLYTSPHLVDFRERIKVNGEMVPKEFVYEFLRKNTPLFEKHSASFFEITTALAFAWFAKCRVDIAVIECGLGGRLDSTNIIRPMLSIITNIGLDHCQYLGNTLKEIAFEKAGIIKRGVPVVIGECGTPESGVREVFERTASDCGSQIYFAEKLSGYIGTGTLLSDAEIRRTVATSSSSVSCASASSSAASASASSAAASVTAATSSSAAPSPRAVKPQSVRTLASCILAAVDADNMDLKGDCQKKNVKSVSYSLALLLDMLHSAYKEEVVSDENNSGNSGSAGNDGNAGNAVDVNEAELAKVIFGIENAARLTGLRGRWEKLSDSPLTICDIGHNAHGMRLLCPQIKRTLQELRTASAPASVSAESGEPRLYMVFGIMRDKDLSAELEYLPKDAHYLFVNADSPRALPADVLCEKMKTAGFDGDVAAGKSVKAGVIEAKRCAAKKDFIFIGGSSYVVAEALAYFDKIAGK